MPHLEHNAKLLSPRAKLSRGRLAVYGGLTAIVGIIVVVVIFAATGSLAFEAESGIVGGAATVATVSGASGGKAVKFGSGATPTPTPPPTTTPSSTPVSGWPDASNTGVKAGTSLTAYTGSMNLSTPGTVIENKIISSNHGMIRITASNVTIRNSQILGTEIYIDNNSGNTSGIVLDHLTIDGQGKGSTVNNDYAVGGGYGGGFELSFSNVSNWDTGVTINSEPANVYVHDNYIHNLGPASDVHKTALSSNGGGGNARVIHNNLDCGVSGCSAAMSLYGDFAVISGWDVESNLFNTEGSYCSYTGTVDGKKFPNADHITWKNNQYGKQYHTTCGIYGPTTSWGSGGGTNVWSGNVWAGTSTAVNP